MWGYLDYPRADLWMGGSTVNPYVRGTALTTSGLVGVIILMSLILLSNLYLALTEGAFDATEESTYVS